MEEIDITQVKPNPSNPRTITPENFEKLKKSIQEFPQMLKLRPLVIDKDNVTLGGNMRLKAMTALGYKTVPVIRAENLTPEQIKEFIAKDNIGYGEWDWAALKADWDLAKLDDWGLPMPEFASDEPEAKEDSYEIAEEIKTDIKEGDLITIGPHRLICGSSTETNTWEKLMDGKLADMVMTDPPYNVDYHGSDGAKIMNDKQDDRQFYQFLLDFYMALGSFTKPGGGWYVWHADSEGANFRQAMKDSGLMVKQCLIWVKNSLVMGRQDYQWKHEPCLYGWKPGAAHYFTEDRTKTTVIEDYVDYKKLKKEELLKIVEEIMSDKTKTTIIHMDKPKRNDLHPTMKPILLLAPLILNSSKANEIVSDGFLGSGSTMVASHQLNRKCYGMELDPKYCQVIVDRMHKLDPTLPIAINGKKYLPLLNER